MALVRILVDGFSVLHSCPDIAPGQPRYSAAARDELVSWLTQYRDAIGTPITIVFDGANARPGAQAMPSLPEMEILYSRAGQTAGQLIERAVHRFRDYGEVLVVTDDSAERTTIASAGGLASSCANFAHAVRSALTDPNRELHHHNRRELNHFRKARHS